MKYLIRLAGLAVMVVAIPLMIPGLLVVGLCFVLPLGIVFFLLNLIGEWFLTLKLALRNRFVPWYLLRELQDGDRLIVEYPTLGWRTSRLWLVPSSLYRQCPFTPPKSEEERKEIDDANEVFPVHPFEEWVYQKVISPVSGGGILIRAWNGRWRRKYFERRYPSIEVIDVWTGPVRMKTGNNSQH
ncbi:MAG: hypothetical protein FJ308_03885 [Planctomycetes bacterium]|nr:hypothetical protein [Planctomycetota bacterium]